MMVVALAKAMVVSLKYKWWWIRVIDLRNHCAMQHRISSGGIM
jgi:hypothetical protein